MVKDQLVIDAELEEVLHKHGFYGLDSEEKEGVLWRRFRRGDDDVEISLIHHTDGL